MSTTPDRYVLDANAFIQAKRKFYRSSGIRSKGESAA
jgi:hypothetical protein